MNWDLFADLAGFTLGALIHLGIVISDWVEATPPELGFKDFFKHKKNRAIAVRGGLIDLVVLAAWNAGVMPDLLGLIGFHFAFLTAAPAGSRFLMAIGWGYAADSFGKRLYRRFEKKAGEED